MVSGTRGGLTSPLLALMRMQGEGTLTLLGLKRVYLLPIVSPVFELHLIKLSEQVSKGTARSSQRLRIPALIDKQFPSKVRQVYQRAATFTLSPPRSKLTIPILISFIRAMDSVGAEGHLNHHPVFYSIE
jgi:hypothetical protein